MDQLIINRDELYKLVWSEPISKLSKYYGLSDVGLAKICKRLNVPRPGIGFWARKQAGRYIEVPTLPPLKSGQQTEVHLRPKEKPPVAEPENPELEARIAFEKQPINHITVPERLFSPHPLILQTKRSLKGVKPDKYGRIWSWHEPCLDIRVSPANLDRALRIMHALIKALNKRGFEVVAIKRDTYQQSYGCSGKHAYALVLDEKIYFSIEEASKQAEREPTKEEKRNREQWPSFYSSKLYEYSPSGRLSLKINNWGGSSFQKVLTDSKKRRLEDCLNDFICALYRVAFREKEYRKQKEEREKAWQEEQRRREERERLYREEQERIKVLKDATDNWHLSRQIRSFIQAYRDAMILKHGHIEPGSKLDQWLMWASDYADKIDPIK